MIHPAAGAGRPCGRAEVGRVVVVDRDSGVHLQRHGRGDDRRRIVEAKRSAAVASVEDSGGQQFDPFGRGGGFALAGADAEAGAPAVSITNEGISLPARVSLSPPVRVVRCSIEGHCAPR